MAFVSDDKKREILDRVRLEDLARDYNVLLKSSGGARLLGLCPFHNEKTPSFNIDTERQLFHCYGCKAGGDIFSFLQRIESVDFVESLEMLARRAGVTLETRDFHGQPSSGDASSNHGLKNSIYEALSLAESFYHDVLLRDPRAEAARSYLRSRGINESSWTRFRLGYSPDAWTPFLDYALSRRLKNVNHDILLRAGLARQSQKSQNQNSKGYDYFRGRLMFPIADGQKRVIGFGARTLGSDEPKYLNSPTTPVFDKSQVLYGLPQARAAIQKIGRVSIVEGYTDVIAAHQEGLEHHLASLGTAFTAENARRLRRLAPRVDLIFDGDFAGQSAAERSLSLLVGENLDVRVCSLAEGKDPCDAVFEMGGEAFQDCLDESAVSVFEFKWNRTVGALSPKDRSASAISRGLDEILELLSKVPDVITRKLHMKDLAERLDVPAEDIEKKFRARASSRPRVGGAVTPESSYGRVPAAPAVDRAVGIDPATRSGGALRSAIPSLAEVVLECLVAEPDRAGERLAALPENFLQGDGFASNAGSIDCAEIFRAIQVQIERGELNLEDLPRSIENPEAVPVLANILARVEERNMYQKQSGWSALGEMDDLWERCLKDIRRNTLELRRKELEAVKRQARTAGDRESWLVAERDYRDLLKEIAALKTGHA